MTPIPLILLHHLADDVCQSRKLPVVAFWALAPECLVQADGEVEVVSGIDLAMQGRALPSTGRVGVDWWTLAGATPLMQRRV